jgi:hypothetical protein
MKTPLLIVSTAVLLGCGATVLAQSVTPGLAPPKQIDRQVGVKVECPVPSVTVGVKSPSPLPSPWWDTPFVMSVDSTSLSTVGGAPAIRCLYKGSGREWTIERPLAPDYQSCSVSGKSFLCIPKV